MVIVPLSDQEKEIIQQVADYQIASYIRLYSNPALDKELEDKGFAVNKSELQLELASITETYENIKLNEQLLFKLELAELCSVKDVLLNYADEFEEDGFLPPSLYYKLDIVMFLHDHIN